MDSPGQDHYATLQVHPSALPDVIDAAYRRLALIYHPDKNPSPDAHKVMTHLNLAHSVLMDPQQRAAYDRQRREPEAKATSGRAESDVDSNTGMSERNSKPQYDQWGSVPHGQSTSRAHDGAKGRPRTNRSGVEQDHYAVLGVRPDATPLEILSAYLDMLRLYYNEGNKSDRDLTIEEREIVDQLNFSYGVIGDSDLRAGYDRHYYSSGAPHSDMTDRTQVSDNETNDKSNNSKRRSSGRTQRPRGTSGSSEFGRWDWVSESETCSRGSIDPSRVRRTETHKVQTSWVDWALPWKSNIFGWIRKHKLLSIALACVVGILAPDPVGGIVTIGLIGIVAVMIYRKIKKKQS